MFTPKFMDCPICGMNNPHLLGHIEVKTDDNYQTEEIKVNGKYSFPLQTRYEYRTQGNIHLLFMCENKDYFFLSFDGHKGSMIVNNNPLIEQLELFLNSMDKNSGFKMNFDFEILAEIERFIKLKGEKKYNDIK